MKTVSYLLAFGFLLCLPRLLPAMETKEIVFETDFLQFTIGQNGQNLHFIDKRDGKDYCDLSSNTAFARVRIGKNDYSSTGIAYDGNRLEARFENTDFIAIIRPTIQKTFLTFKVEETKGSPVDELTFLNVSLSPGDGGDSFAGCALALNLQTNVNELPQANTVLRAMCYPRFGMAGAEVAVIGCPQSQLRDVMKEVVSQAKDLPHSTIGGPWALDAELSRGSYLFNFDGMTEESVEQWIALAQSMGITQIDFHGGSSFRFGDCEPNPKTFPNGKASFKKIIDRLHEAGISAGLHTYAFFIDKKCPWVTPTPDPRLAKDATFTLAAGIAEDATTIPVVETTQSMSTITGFFVRNSVTLQIGDELITYKGISKEPPYSFTDCQRGAYGTKIAAHSAASKVSHLKECFGLFVPDADTMLADVAAKTAEMFNECGFDMIYLDALDGEDILGGAENAWHYGSKFAFDIVSRLKKSPLMEMSTFHHHLWFVRSRMGAWDHPTRGHKRFIDIHCQGNQSISNMFLNTQLGWWAIKTWTGTQGEPTFADDIEYLCGKSIGTGAGISIMGINPDNRNTPIYQRLAKIIKNYETLRLSNYFDASIKEKLCVPGDEFTLLQNEDGQWKLYPANYDKHKVVGLSDGSAIWNATNSHSTQPLKVRIEALTSARSYDATDSITLLDFSSTMKWSEVSSANGVQFKIETSNERVKSGPVSGKITAANTGQNDPKAAWGHASMTFSTPVNLSQNQALGVWIFGDGKGEVFNFQMKSPEHLISGLAERYVVIDFRGWKYFELLELESDRYGDYHWPYGNGYSIYRETVHFNQIENLSVWCNDIPLGESVCCWIAPVKALPHQSAKFKNPSLSIGGKKLTFPVELESGQYLEFYSMDDCKQYGADGSLIGEIKPTGEVPNLANGVNRIQFDCEDPVLYNPRARVTVISQGDPM